MKLKFKFTALSLAIAMGAGMLVGCNNNKPTPQPPAKYLVNVPTSTDYRIDGIVEDRQYVEGAAVSFTVEVLNEDKELTAAGYQIGAQRTALDPVAGVYTFNMPAQNVSLFVTLHDIERYALSHTGTLRVGGDPVTFSLELGSDPVTDWSLEASSGGEHVNINGHNATGVSQGQVTFAAIVGGQQVAYEEVTVERAAIYTIREAIDDAWENVDNFNDNTKSTQSTNKYKIRAKVVFMGSVYNSKVEMLVDDGTGILDYQVSSSSAITKFAVGDVIEFEEKVQNYFGLMETFSSSVNYITKLTDVTINTTPFTDVTSASQYDTVFNNNLANSGEHKVVPINVQAQAKKHQEGDQQKNRYEVVGATKGFFATTKSVISLDWTEGVNYNFHGYLLNWNDGDTYKYANFVALEQTRLVANSVSIDQGEEETVNLNNDLQLTYTTDPVGAGVEVSWTSSQPTIASVSATGLVHAAAAGDAVITLTVDGHTDTITIHVPAALKPATGCSFSETSTNAVFGTDLDLKPLLTVTPADTTDTAVWTSDDTEVATVANGVVTPLKAGQATITVTFNASVYDSILVNVTVPHGMSADDPLTAQEAKTIGAALSDKGTTAETYYIRGIVTVNTTTTGKVFGVLDDLFTLYQLPATDELKAKFELGADVIVCTKIYRFGSTIENPSNSGSLYSADNTVPQFIRYTGETVVQVAHTSTLTATVYPASLGLTPSFASSNTDVATVDSSGVVTGVATGKATVTISYDTLSLAVGVTIIGGELQNGTINLANLSNISGTPTDEQIVWSIAPATLTNNKGSGTKVTNYYPGTSGQSYTQTRFYNKNTSVIAPNTGYEIVQVEFVCATDAYATAFAGFTFTNATAAKSGTHVILDVDTFTSNITWTNTATVGFTSVIIYYTVANA